MTFFILSHAQYMLFDQATYLCIILSLRLCNSLWESDVLLFLEFINVVFTFALYLY